MNIAGTIVEIFDTQNVTDTFKKREFVVEFAENPQYPEFVKFEMIQDRCAILDPFKPGDEVSVDFNLKGRKWTDPEGKVKYFNSLQAWRVDEKKSAPAEAGPAIAAESKTAKKEPDWIGSADDADDLPF